MRRLALDYLVDWLVSDRRLPLVIRGARQVGKTWMIRELAKNSSKELIEFNFESNPQSASLFASNDPKEILLSLSSALGRDIVPKDTVLFLDEIQAVPQLFSKLRWFAEEMPELATVAAGSLLEFVLAEHSFSMPVGRITFMHVEPLSFEEFLLARGKEQLQKYLADFSFKRVIPEALHEQLMTLFKEYTLVGGMPAAVADWCAHQSLMKVGRVHHDLLATYRGDFSKYRNRIALERLEEASFSVPRMLGQKFVFSQVNSGVPSEQVKQAIRLLNLARVCHRISSTGADGVPLASQTKPKFFKEIMLDVGLVCSALGVTLHQLASVSELTLVNSGAIAEQVVGQLLRTLEPFYIEPALFYWQRDERGSEAEVDYVIQYASKIIPVEVKAGKTGTLKSLQLFMKMKNPDLAVRICSAPPRIEKRDYVLLSIPFYLCGQLHRLLSEN
ncbi:MAG: AAA family ATPase [Myxococcaceae bacterium]